jgi:hypothetical protein
MLRVGFTMTHPARSRCGAGVGREVEYGVGAGIDLVEHREKRNKTAKLPLAVGCIRHAG